MTVTAKNTRVQYTGNGLVATYAYDWKILDQADLVVITTDLLGADTTLVLGVGYTVTGAGNDSGGNVVLTNSLATGQLLTVYVDMDIDQPTDLTNQQSPFLERIESALDRQALVSQQLAEKLGRCIQLKPTSTDSSGDLQELLESVDTNATAAAASAATATTQAGLANTARIAAELAETNAEAAAASIPTTFGAFGLTLAETTTASNARAALELGSAAVADTGTGAGDVPVLDAGGKLDAGVFPAATGVDTTARDLAVFDSFLNQIDLGRASGAIPSGYMHLFLTDELATDATYDATGDYYHNTESTTAISGAEGTTIAGTFDINTSAAFDGNESQASTPSARCSTNGSIATARIGKQWSAAKRIGRLRVVGATETGLVYSGASENYTIKLRGSDNGSSWTDLYTSATITDAAGKVTDVATGIDTATAYTHHDVVITCGGNTNFALCEVVFYEYVPPSDMTLVPAAITAGAAPGTVDVYMLHKAVDAVTLNTDLKARVSRDNGSNWSAHVTLAEVCQYDADYKLLKGAADLSALASGTSVKWEVTTLNAKAQRVRAAAMILNS